MDNTDKPDRKDDNRISSVRISSKFQAWKYSRYFKIMTTIFLAALQILLLLLKAHFNREDDQEKAMKAIREAQTMLADLATAFETKIRYSAPAQSQIDHLQDVMDKERKRNESPHP